MEESSDQPAVSICCPLDEVDSPESRCYWNVSVFSSTLPENYDDTLLWSVRFGPCPNDTICYTDFNATTDNSMYSLNDGATPFYESIDGGHSCRIDATDYCYRYDSNGIASETIVTTCRLLAAAKAGVRVYYPPVDAYDIFFIVTMCISLPFLVLTFLVYAIVPELKNLHGSILRSYMSCCFASYMWATAIFIDGDLVCRAFVDVSTHFALLATLFWMNVMCFDIWWTFRSMRLCKVQSTRTKFIIYSIYAWGIPTLIIVVGFIIEFIPDLPEGIVKPGFHLGCWLLEEDANDVYLHGPLYFTLSCNVCFFVLVVVEITRQRNNTALHLDGNESGRHSDEKMRFYLYLKLTVLMGMSWFAEVMPPYLSTLMELPNLLQGLVLFILFVCNDRTKRLLSRRLGWRDWKTRQWLESTVSRILTRSTDSNVQ